MPHTALYTSNWTKTFSRGKSSFSTIFRHRIYDPLSRIVFQCTIGKTKYSIHKRYYSYLVHMYNFTWTNERCVEIPYFSQIVALYSPSKVLEVGNTLSHYQKVKHTVIDKYETEPGVLATDILDYKPRGKFDLIIAISTVEHIGWHEAEKRSQKALEAITHITSLLAPKGRFVFSFPLGVNPSLDKALKENSLGGAKLIFMRRKNRLNIWEETSYPQVKSVKYNTPFPNANALCIATFTRRK